MADAHRSRWRKLLVSALLTSAVALGACGGGDDAIEVSPADEESAADRVAAPKPALCRAPLEARVTGSIETPVARELSGLVRSRTQKDVLWTHNDSGDKPRVLAFSPTGRFLAEVALTGAKARDWEDIAAGRGTLLIGDIGDNDGERGSIVVYRVDEPRVAGLSGAKLSARARPIELRYPDGAHDAEALLRDPDSGAIVVIEKRADGRSGVYVANAPKPGAVTTMRRVGRLFLGGGQLVTAGDVSADGRTIALRTYHGAFVWQRAAGESLTDALLRKGCAVDAEMMMDEVQTETIALTPDGRAFYSVPEGEVPQISRYAPIR